MNEVVSNTNTYSLSLQDKSSIRDRIRKSLSLLFRRRRDRGTRRLRVRNISKKKIFAYTIISVSTALVVIALIVLFSSGFNVITFLENVDFNYYLAMVFSAFIIMVLYDSILLIRKLTRMHHVGKIFSSKLVFGVIHTYFIIVTLSVGIFAYALKHPNLSSTYPVDQAQFESYDDKLQVVFNVPVRVDTLKPSITPEITGTWEWEPYLGIQGLTRKGTFHMSETPYPDERFVAYFAGINKLTDSFEHEYGFVFYSVPTPTLTESLPLDQEENVDREVPITLTFSNSLEESVNVDLIFEPRIEFEYEYISSSQLQIQPLNPFDQGETYTLTVDRYPKKIDPVTKETVDQQEKLDQLQIAFTTVKEPGIDTISPSGSAALADSVFDIKFELDMDPASVEEKLSISPEIVYETDWIDEANLIITPTELLPKDTNFTITFDKGIRSSVGGVVETEIVHNFKTIGPIQIRGFAPGRGESHVNEFRSIDLEFDQEVVTESAQSKFKISPAVAGNFEWTDNKKIVFKPQGSFSLGTTYTVTVEAGVESLHGLPNNEVFSWSFSTRPNSVFINVPMYWQTRSFSCNINTARMILGWKGHFVPGETSLIAEIGHNANRSGDSWTGNPYQEFVGTADGDWGYGVYWPPIQRILSARGISSSPRTGWDRTSLLREVQAGHPVIMWRYNGVGGGQNISWTASDGTYVNAFNGMHGSVVTGFNGPAENPTSIRINDPWLGQLWLAPNTFDWYWSFSGRMALVVY